MKIKIMIVSLAAFGMATGQEKTEIQRLMDAVDTSATLAEENKKLAQDLSVRLKQSLQDRKKLLDALQDTATNWNRAMVDGWTGRVVSLGEKAVIWMEAVKALEKAGALAENGLFLRSGTALLHEEALLRQEWRALVKSPMQRGTRDEAGKAWVAAMKEVDPIGKILGDMSLGEFYGPQFEEWEKWREAPPAPEPEIVE